VCVWYSHTMHIMSHSGVEIWLFESLRVWGVEGVWSRSLVVRVWGVEAYFWLFECLRVRVCGAL